MTPMPHASPQEIHIPASARPGIRETGIFVKVCDNFFFICCGLVSVPILSWKPVKGS